MLINHDHQKGTSSHHHHRHRHHHHHRHRHRRSGHKRHSNKGGGVGGGGGGGGEPRDSLRDSLKRNTDFGSSLTNKKRSSSIWSIGALGEDTSGGDLMNGQLITDKESSKPVPIKTLRTHSKEETKRVTNLMRNLKSLNFS